MIASEDANRWNLLAVERLAEIGRLEALSSPVDKGEPPVDQTTLQGNDDSSLLDVSSEPLAKEAVEVEEPAVGEPTEVSSLPLAASEPPKEEAIAAPNELITATELAQILRVHQSSVSRAAKEDHESFKKWSSNQKGSAGRTWDFILVQRGGKVVPQYFQVTDTPSV